MKNIFSFIVLFICSFNLQASFIASNKTNIDTDKPVHLIIVGHPDQLGELFIYSALTKTKIYTERSKDAQVIILGRNDDMSLVEDAGLKIHERKSGILKSEVILKVIKKLKNIKSIDIFSHANPYSGATLDEGTFTTSFLDETDKLWDAVATKVNKSSFIFIHGCSTGLKLAPILASKLKIATFAAMTSTDFQFIYKDSFWAFEANGKSKDLSKNNVLNFSNPASCEKNCVRMKPNNATYTGHWGDWSAGGYPTYKLFCGSNENENCEQGALEGLYTFPTHLKVGEAAKSLNSFKEHLTEFLCPHAYAPEKQIKCKESLEKSLTDKSYFNYSPFEGKTLVCDRIRCKAHFNCSLYNVAFNPEKCSLVSESEDESTAFTDEYKFFINIYNKNSIH